MELRDATRDDAEMLFAWTNDPHVRRWSFSHEPIDWHTHLRWLDAVLADERHRLFIAVDDGTPVGQARLDRLEREEGVIDRIAVSIAPAARGRGLGVALILAACDLTDTVVEAEIIPTNERSSRAFAAAGFRVVSSTDAKVTMRRP